MLKSGILVLEPGGFLTASAAFMSNSTVAEGGEQMNVPRKVLPSFVRRPLLPHELHCRLDLAGPA